MKTKTLTTLMAATALFAGLSIANAQNAPSAPNTAPSTMSKSSTGAMTNQKVTGKSKFCIETSPGGSLNCKYASMSACEKAGKAANKECVANPKMGTTGSR